MVADVREKLVRVYQQTHLQLVKIGDYERCALDARKSVFSHKMQ